MIETIYSKLPIFLQNMACTLYGLREKRQRFNSDFEQYLQLYSKSQYDSLDSIAEYESQFLRKMLKECEKNVPYYRSLFTNKNINTDAEIIQLELLNLPILTKEILRECVADLVAENVKSEDKIELHTSGTTGKALTLYRDKLSIAKQWALCYRHRERFNCKFGDLHVNFTGKIVVPTKQKNPPYWRFNRAFNQYLMNMQHINEDNIEAIVTFLNSISPTFYSGYPSIIAEVARLALSRNLVLNVGARPVIVFAGAENTLDYQRADIERWTGASVTDIYGLTEGNCHLSRCEHGFYHVDHEFAYVECVDPEELEGGRKRGRLVGTSLTSSSMPLIRYDTGDIAIWMPDDYVCDCGRKTAVIESIEGRVDDYVKLNDGRRVMRFDYLFKGTDIIKEAQVCQYELGKVVIKLVLREPEKTEIEKELRYQFAKWITDDMQLSFEYLDRIPRSNTGKFKAVRSFL